MKRALRLLVLSFAIILFSSNFVQAAGTEIPLKINSNHIDVVEAQVEVNGFPLHCDFSPYVYGDRTFVPIRELTELMGANVEWDQKTKSVHIALQDQTVKLKIDSNIVYVDGQKKAIEETSIPRLAMFSWPRVESKTMVPLRFLSESFGFNVEWNQDNRKASIWNIEKPNVKAAAPVEQAEPVEQSEPTEQAEYVESHEGPDQVVKNNGSALVVIDAGHGGHDSGAVGADGKTREKDLNLTVSKKVAALLRAAGYDVIETRSRDEFVGLYDRADIANDTNAEIFISIHFNSAGASSATGIEVLYASEDDIAIKSGDQTVLARLILDELIKSTGARDRGIKNRPDLAVLRKTEMPAALVELGFLSNPDDLAEIKSSGYLDILSEAIYKGIIKYNDLYL